MIKILLLIPSLQFFVFTTCFAQNRAQNPNQNHINENHFEIGLGLIEASEYTDLMKQIYSGLSGGGFWIKLEAGYSFMVLESFYLTPRIDLLGSRIKTTTSGFEFAPNTKANLILLTGISGRYILAMILPRLYTSIDLSLIFPFSDLNKIEFKSNGLGLGIGVGYILSKKYELELGYISLPIQTQFSDLITSDANFGGFSFTFRVRL